MKNIAFNILLISMILMGCNTIEETEIDLPDVAQLTPDNIDTDLPVINFKVDESDWKTMTGLPHEKIYTAATFSYSSHSKIENYPVQLRIKGAASVEYSLKSLEVIFNQEIENQQLRIIPKTEYNQNLNIDQLKNFRLRNSGQDFTKTMFKDKALTLFADHSNLNFMIMQAGPASQVFVNNKYYGLLNIRTESNLNSIAKQKAVPVNEVVVYKVDVDNGNIEYNEGALNLTPNLEALIDRGNPSEVSEWINESSFIDYILFQDYIGNTDWPHNNIRMYSKNGEAFKFVLYDLDHGSEKTKNPLLPELEYISHDLGKIYRAYRKVKGFDERLKKRQSELYKFWSPTQFYDIVESLRKEIKVDIQYQMAKHNFPESMYQWNWEIEKMVRDFERRDHYIRNKYEF